MGTGGRHRKFGNRPKMDEIILVPTAMLTRHATQGPPQDPLLQMQAANTLLYRSSSSAPVNLPLSDNPTNVFFSSPP